MKMDMKIEILNKETIKPSSPTPSEFQHFNLSLLDQLATASNVPVILFFANSDSGDTLSSFEERSNHLKKSLSELLTLFYPLAGRARENSSIDCNDEGVDYIEGRATFPLSDFLIKPTPEELLHFLPVQIESAEASTGRMLLVQVTLFECGGIAMGISFSHKLVDASSISTIIKTWSTIAIGSQKETKPIEFMQATLLPPPQGIPISVPPTDLGSKLKCTSRRLVFNPSNLTHLKSKALSQTVLKPTRVEAVTALVWKCAMKAAITSSNQVPNISVVSQTVNLRKRLTPPLSENSIGNLLGNFVAKPIPPGERDLKELVDLLRDGISEFNEKGVERYQGEDAFMKIIGGLQESGGNLYGREDVAFYIVSSWNRFGLYDTDFGWGKPTWVSIGSIMFMNFVVLMDMKDGEGIEAWVTLKEEEMAEFEKDEELLQFASINPSVIS